MKLNRFEAMLGLGIAALLAAPASAVTFTNVGDTANISFNQGLVGGNFAPGLTGEIQYTLASITGLEWVFNYTLKNTSTSPVNTARISAFGFNTDPNFVGAGIVSGSIYDGIGNGNVPGLPFNVEFCATAGPNCSGGGGDGTWIGGVTSGAFKLIFGSTPGAVTLSDHYMRVQSFASTATPGSSGTITAGAVPEPASWAMLVAGFGLVGATIRRRRETVVAA